MKIYKVKAIIYLIFSIVYLILGVVGQHWWMTLLFGILAIAYAFLGGYDSCAYGRSEEGDNQNGRG